MRRLYCRPLPPLRSFVISGSVLLRVRTVQVRLRVAGARSLQVLLQGFLVRCCAFLFLMLRHPFRALLHQKFLLFAKFRFGINSRYKKSVFLHDRCRNRPETDVGLQTLKDRVVCQVRVTDDLAVVCRVLGHPAFQLDHQSDFREQNRL